jgi:hypothetical protein
MAEIKYRIKPTHIREHGKVSKKNKRKDIYKKSRSSRCRKY